MRVEEIDQFLVQMSEGKVKLSWLTYPPVTDYDPYIAANFLSIEDSEKYLPIMLEAFGNIAKTTQKYKVLENSILYNKVTFKWFINFTLALGNIIEGENFKADFPYEKLPEDEGKLLILPPMYRTVANEIKRKKYKLINQDSVNLWRVNYIQSCYELTDFRGGFPSWYILSQTTIYEEYNYKINRRVRIDFSNGEFLYYLAGASDKWQQIVGVPVEMDSVVASLLFKN